MGFPSASKTLNETETKLNISLTPPPIRGGSGVDALGEVVGCQ
jgi:hypothetical protein